MKFNAKLLAGLVTAVAIGLGAPSLSAQDAPKSIKIGYAISKTGPNAGGANITQIPNYQLWVQEVNAKGGLMLKAYGKRIPIELMRNGKRMTVTAVVAKRPTDDELAQQSFNPNAPQNDDQFNRTPKKQGEGLAEQSLGLSVLPLNPQIARQIGMPDSTTGLVIAAVDGSSDAGSKGLQRGDVILSVNYVEVTTVAAFETQIRQAKSEGRSAVLLRVQRRGQPPAYLPVRLR